MTVTVVQPRIGAAAITARPGELLDIATITEDVSYLEPEGLFQTLNCLTTDAVPILPCPVNVLAAPVLNAPSTQTTGGTLAAGTYRAILTGVNARGQTVGSNEVSRVTTGATSTATFTWTDLSGETEYRLYLTNGASGSQAQYVTIAAGTTTYTMTAYPPAGATAGTVPTQNTAVVSVSKTFETPSWQDGLRFGVYSGLTCKSVGFDIEESTAEAVRVFLANESVGVERALMNTRFRVNGSVWAAATDLTPAGGAVEAEVGLAILEGHASWNYAGVPTIHAPRSIGALLLSENAVDKEGTRFVSKQGSKVASGGGYEEPNTSPAGVAAPAGEKWMYSSGEVMLARGPVFSEPQIDRSTNEVKVLVERLYVAAVDCYTAAVRVKVN